MIKLCRDLMDGNIEIIKDRPKIKAGVGGNFFVKLYKLPGAAAQIRRRFRKGRAYHCLFAADALHKCGALTPKTMAAVELRRGLHICDFLITEKLPGKCLTSDRFFSEENYSGTGAWDFLMANILPEIVRIHNAGIAHGDLNLRNIYPDSGQAGFIDLDGTCCNSAPLDIPVREKELARLLSGFLRIANFKTMKLDELAAGLSDRYRELAGIQCDKENIIRRADYLVDR